MDWLTGGGGGGGNGWDDDDDLGEFSDQSLEEEEEESGNEGIPQFSHSVAPQAQTGVQLGGGMFMGRLTRFIEAVTQPSSGEEDEEGDEGGEGWGDDDALDDIDDVDADEVDEMPQQAFQHPASPVLPSAAAAISNTFSRLTASPMELPPPGAGPSQSQLVDSGWDDDLDLSFEPQAAEEQFSSNTSVEHMAPLNDVDTTKATTAKQQEEENLPSNVSFRELPTTMTDETALVANSAHADGWGDTDDGLDDIVVEDEVVVEETMPPAAPSRQVSSLSNAAKTEAAVAHSTSSGWDEDDEELEGLEEGDYVQEEETSASQMVDHIPPPPPPPLPIQTASNSRETSTSTLPSQSVSFGGASMVPLASPSVVQNGWDEDFEDPLTDQGEEPKPETHSENPTKIILDHTPPPPPPGQNQGVSFAEQSIEAIAPSAASGWDEDDETMDDLDVEETKEVEKASDDGKQPTKILDHTPPPPPPPTQNDTVSHAHSYAARSAGAVATSNESGWDDDGTLDDLEAEDNNDEEDEKKVVDLTPPPPLPPRESKRATSSSAIAVGTIAEDNGWDDDDDDLGNLDEDDDEQDNNTTLLVDHTPPPPPPPKVNGVGRDTTTDVAVNDIEEDDDISRDDTLSIANSRARYEEHQYQLAQQANPGPPLVDQIPIALSKPVPFKRAETADAIRSGNSMGSSTLDDFRQVGDVTGAISEEIVPIHDNIVDHTPSLGRMDRHSSAEESLMAIGGAGGNSSVSDSWDSLSDRISDVRSRNRRMVDLTPPAARFHRGMPIDTSLAVAGHTSVGESLDSIDEEEEEPDSPGPGEGTSTPSAVESGWGGFRQQPREEYTMNVNGSISTAIPFGSAITPTATGRIPRTTVEANEDDDDDGVPLVDHTPLPLVKNNSTAASVDVLSVSSEEGDLGESIVGIDDVKEDLYGQVVDHTPATPNPAERPKVGGAGLLGAATTKLEDDTVAGVAETTDVEKDIKADDEMDDESSRGTKTTLEEYENRSLISSVRVTIPEEKQLVDHVPTDRKISRTTDASTVVFADASTGSSQVDDDIVNDDDTSPAGFGPIVDHTPSVHIRSARSVATSVVTQNSGLDVDLKEDEDLDNTVGPGASTDGGDDGWDGEQASLPPSVSEEKHLVDHVPRRNSRHLLVDGSMRVLLDNGDDMTQVDTIAEDAAVDFGLIVDHTPFTARSSGNSVGASMATQAARPDDEMDNTTAVGGASTAGGDGWDNDIPDLEDISAGEEGIMEAIEEPTMVDHVPRRSFSRPTDASTVVVVDPMDAASAVGYDEPTVPNATDGRFGPVVDHTPTPPLSATHMSVDASMRVQANDEDAGNRNDEGDEDDGGTWFGASTVGGVSTVGASGEVSSAGDDSSRGGWEDDGDILDDLASPTTPARRVRSNDSHVVDHVPKITTPGPTDVSLAVVIDPSVVSSHEKEENDDNIDDGSFGAVVDHTPSVTKGIETKGSRHSVANSMATIATGICADIKRDEEMDETTWNGGASTNDEGWDQDEVELELNEADEDQMPPLVDHVPERPESRPTDASTFVAGEPSEIFSQVDDLGQDETHFGPVVDQTPRGQFSVHASAAGSTIVNIASVAEDDLDVAVEKAIDGEDPQREAEEQTGWQETLPNPQSGNDEDTQRDDEQLVDYVPAEQEEETPDIVRDGSSEMATVGEKSTMLPADDPKEDEFGPVVDQLPISEDASPRALSPVNATSTDDRKMSGVSSSAAQIIDSVAPNFSVESKESKEDGLDEDEFGPVVDHLPTASSRASFTPSRGGSTVDALATVSEVEDDYVAGEGWEDDVDIDVGDQASPNATTRVGEDRNLSVKWVDGLNGESTGEKSTGDSAYFDAEIGDSSRLPLNETRYYDPELGDTNAWGSLHLDDVDDSDDTPPSTPRGSFESRQLVEGTVVDQGGAAATVMSGEIGCKLCSNASTAECPCVKKLLASNAGNDGMIGTLKTPDGNFLRVNFDQLLETEMMKRRLVEKEFQALRTTIESLKSSKDTLVLAGENQMEILNKMKDSNNILSGDLQAALAEVKDAQAQRKTYEEKSKTLEEQVAVLDEEKCKIETDYLVLKRDMEVLEARMTQVSSSATSNLSARENELQSEISRWKGSHEDLTHKIARFETECENLRGKNESLYEDLESYRESMTKLEEEKAAMSSKESSLIVEIKHLKSTLQSHRAATEGTVQSQLTSMQAEIATKSGECAELESQMAMLQKKLSVADAENLKQAEELSQMVKEREQMVAHFEDRISKTKIEIQDAMRMKDEAIGELKTKLMLESQIIQSLKEEKAALEQATKTSEMTHKAAIAEKNRQILAVDNARKITVSKMESLEKEKHRLATEVASLVERSEVTEAQSKILLNVRNERNSLRNEVDQSKLTIAQLQTQIKQNERTLQDSVSKWEREIDILQREREKVAGDAALSQQKLGELERELQSSHEENDGLQQMVAELKSKCDSLEEFSRRLSSEEETSLLKVKKELAQVRSQLNQAQNRNEALLAEQTEQRSQYAMLEDRLNTVSGDLDVAHSERSLIENRLEESEKRTQSLVCEMEQVKADRIKLQQNYEQLVTNSSSAIEDAQKSANAMAIDQKRLKDLTSDCDSLRQEVAKLRENRKSCRARIESLSSELEQSGGLLANKDQSIVILREQQKSSRAGFMDLQQKNKEMSTRLEYLDAKISEFEQERATIGRLEEEHMRSFERTKEELDEIKRERDTLQEERRMLEEENEEMLVQFGLLKEDMDATDDQVDRLAAERDSWKQSAEEWQTKFEESQKKIEELTANLKDEAHKALTSIQAAKADAVQQRVSLEGTSNELAEKNRLLENRLLSFECEKIDLLAQINELGRQVSEAAGTSKAKESRLLSIISDLEGKNHDMSNQQHVHENQITELQAALVRSEIAAGDAADLRSRLRVLEQSLAASERQMKQKDGAIADLRSQLEDVGNSPSDSAELESLRRTLQEMEESAERDRANIQELEGLSDDTTKELKVALDQLSSSKDMVEQLTVDLNEARSKQLQFTTMQERLFETERQLAQANMDASSFRAESIDLRGRLAALESELEGYRRVSEQPTKEPSGESSAELQSLRQQIELLQQQQIASSSETGAREELIEREVHLLQQQMRQKDGEISKLERELQSLGSDLSHKQKELHSKQEYVDKLSSELENLRSQASKPATARALELTRDEAEDAEKMRSQIISLARALEQSEGRRAVAIERLENERQANADSLRRMTESVKRFYSTLSLGDN